jgi:[acyl-carrier-protein] S-malonyltransferase
MTNRTTFMDCTAYVFPGQGSQQVGMGAALSAALPIARATFAEADEILGLTLSALCFEGPADLLTDTRNAQPAILTTSIAALRAVQAERPDLAQPCFVAGHSLGEYSALVAAGALAFADAVRLTRARGECMAEAGVRRPGSMAAILRLEDAQVAALCAQAAAETGAVVQVANYNSPGQVVISGEHAGVERASALATAAGGRPRPLAVSIASHSALMAAAAATFAAHVASTPFQTPHLPIVGNITAQPLTEPEAIRQELVAQLTSPVRWTDSVRTMATGGARRFVEIGPGQVLAGLIKRIEPEAAIANVAEPGDVAAL